MDCTHETLHSVLIKTNAFDSSTARFLQRTARSESRPRGWARITILPLALAIGLVCGPAQAQADGGASGTASAVIAGVSLVSSWINAQTNDASAAGYAAEWGSDCDLDEDSTTDTGWFTASAEGRVDGHCGWALGLGSAGEGPLGYWSQGWVSGSAYTVAKFAKNGQSHNVYAWGKGAVDGKSKGKGKGSPGIGPRQGAIQPPLMPHTVVARYDPSVSLTGGVPNPALGAGLGFGANTILNPPDWGKIILINKLLRDLNAAPGEVYALLFVDELDMNAPKGAATTASSWAANYSINGQQVATVSAGVNGDGEFTVEGLSPGQYSSEYDADSDSYSLSLSGSALVGALYLGEVSVPGQADTGAPSSMTVAAKVEADADSEDAKDSSGSEIPRTELETHDDPTTTMGSEF